VRLATLVALSVLLAGCVRGCTSSRPPIHLNPNMDDQPRATALAASDFFYDGKAMRSPIPGTVARQDAVEPGAFESGRDGTGGGFVTAIPPAAGDAVGEPLAVRGAERFAIYCAACHGAEGDGQGMLFHRSGVISADLRIPRLVDMPDGQLYDVITNGFGLMPAYRAQVPVADRWAIVAFVRQLQADSPVAASAPGDPQTTAVGGDGTTPSDSDVAADSRDEATVPAAPTPGGAP
jgi:mono/diheme cytochrome c family protein